jgi:uncharacterized protein (TIGR02594 family)
MKWMDAAWSEVGTDETPGPKSTPAIVQYFAEAGHPGTTSDEIPWCAAFVGACLARSDLKPTGSLRARSYLEWGNPLDGPRVGAVCVLKRGKSETAGHVGFVIGWTGQHVHLLGGNQADSVNTQSYLRSDVLGFRWPPEPAGAVAKTSRKERIADVQTKALVTVGGATGAVTVAQEVGWLETIAPILAFAMDSASLLVIGAVVLGLAVSETIRQLQRQDIAEGRYRPSGEQ